LSATFRPVQPAALPDLLAERLDALPVAGRALLVAIDGPRCAEPSALAGSLLEPLRVRGRATDAVAAKWFWRDASLRLENGREDVESFAGWLDTAALLREVLHPLGPAGSGIYLRSLRDPVTNRATRARGQQAKPGAIVLVSGELLLGRGLPFDFTIHLSVSPAARARRTDADWQWTLPAFDRYDAEVRPADTADVVIRVDDPRHPALRGS
jgi:hypothetical protein